MKDSTPFHGNKWGLERWGRKGRKCKEEKDFSSGLAVGKVRGGSESPCKSCVGHEASELCMRQGVVALHQ